MERKIDFTEPENYLSLLPEIANLLNQSVSSIERYPTDIQRILCEVYVNNYHSDEITIKQALGQVVQLNTETEKQIEQAKKQTPEKAEHKKQLSVQGILNREQIIENARIISHKSQRNYGGSPEMENESLNIKNGG